ncbi:MAG: 4a-hydroxytetrahydrobiopterin dehydratase [Caldilineales bacterium]|nr:4a-hydroxytetrahydrobiopterin dehydratase [Caldilineales bacterium]
MTTSLADESCRGEAVAALTPAEIAALQPQIPDWQIVTPAGVAQLHRVFTFPDFVAALAFTHAVGALAEAEGHHPALLTEWGRVQVMWWTHSVQGLHRNDFIAAAKTDRLFAER